MKKHILCLIFSFWGSAVLGQGNTLEKYIATGIESNLTLQQQGHQIQKSQLALEEAKRLSLPNIASNFTYTTAQGGREIFFPVGDIINPLYYKTGLAPVGSNPVPNVREAFFPKHFYDIRAKSTYPIYNPDLRLNREIKSQQIALQQTDNEIIKRDIRRDIQVAYFNYMKATEAINIYENARKLLAESQRVSQALVKQEMATPIVLVRAENEIGKLEADLAGAKIQQSNAAAYFNFLLNRPLTEKIVADTSVRVVFREKINEEREEIKKIGQAISLNETILAMNQTYKKPKIGLALDVGSQGFLARIQPNNIFALFGFSMDLPLYSFGRNQLKVKQQEQEIAVLRTQQKQIQNQLNLQIFMAENAVNAAVEIRKNREISVTTARRYATDIFKKYKANTANYLDVLDAQTQLLNAGLQANIAAYEVLIRRAELERAKP